MCFKVCKCVHHLCPPFLLLRILLLLLHHHHLYLSSSFSFCRAFLFDYIYI
jgi:hypothetical protein